MKENMLLRKLLWLRHGCPPHGLYGDDGEMQCSTCGLDFKRNKAEFIERKWIEENNPKMKEFFEKQKEELDMSQNFIRTLIKKFGSILRR